VPHDPSPLLRPHRWTDGRGDEFVKIVYVAGKFRGKTAWEVAENVRAAERVGFEVAKLGAMPLIPHANTSNFDGTLTAEFWLSGTLALMLRCDAVMMVPGWPESQGARLERDTAKTVGLPVFDAGDYQALADWLAAVAAPVVEAEERGT